jgi:hypothetical protein
VIVGINHCYSFEGAPNEHREFAEADPNCFDPSNFSGHTWDNPNLANSEFFYARVTRNLEPAGWRIIFRIVDGSFTIVEKVTATGIAAMTSLLITTVAGFAETLDLKSKPEVFHPTGANGSPADLAVVALYDLAAESLALLNFGTEVCLTIRELAEAVADATVFLATSPCITPSQTRLQKTAGFSPICMARMAGMLLVGGGTGEHFAVSAISCKTSDR